MITGDYIYELFALGRYKKYKYLVVSISSLDVVPPSLSLLVVPL